MPLGQGPVLLSSGGALGCRRYVGGVLAHGQRVKPGPTLSARPVVFDVRLTLSFVSSCLGINDGYFQSEIGATTSVVFNRLDESMSLEAIQVPPTSPP